MKKTSVEIDKHQQIVLAALISNCQGLIKTFKGDDKDVLESLVQSIEINLKCLAKMEMPGELKPVYENE